MQILYLDTETTGLLAPHGANITKQPYIIDIGIIIANDDDGEIKETGRFSTLVKPPVSIPEEVVRLTGIDDLIVADAPVFVDIFQEFKQVISSADYLVAHNAAFDTSVIKYELQRNNLTMHLPKIVCTVEEFRPFFGYNPNLIEVYKFVLGRELQEEHRAVSDAFNLYEICRKEGIPC